MDSDAALQNYRDEFHHRYAFKTLLTTSFTAGPDRMNFVRSRAGI
jgi:hypothetical protein